MLYSFIIGNVYQLITVNKMNFPFHFVFLDALLYHNEYRIHSVLIVRFLLYNLNVVFLAMQIEIKFDMYKKSEKPL
jgi:hypothetical protein